MGLLWFLAGAVSGLAAAVVLAPVLRTIPGLGSLPPVTRPVSAGAAAILVAVVAGSLWIDHARTKVPAAAGGFGDAVKVFDNATSAPVMPGAMPGATSAAPVKGSAGSMDSAIADLEARLAKGGGSP